MKKITLVLLVILPVFLSCNVSSSGRCVKGKGSIKTEERQISNFSKINLRSSADVTISYSDHYSVKVSDYENLLPILETDVSGKTLTIDFEQCVQNSKAHVEITMPKIEDLSVLGSGDVSINGEFEPVNDLGINLSGSGNLKVDGYLADNISLVIMGSGNADLNLTQTTKDFVVKLVGSGDASVSGNITNTVSASLLGSGDLIINLSSDLDMIVVKTSGSGDAIVKGNNANTIKLVTLGSGDLDASEISAKNVEVKSSGSGDVKVQVTDSLSARLLGSGDLYYIGNPDKFYVNSLGSGSIIKR